jgi:peptidoglycan/LPS O-acetylase OafA/YrhL
VLNRPVGTRADHVPELDGLRAVAAFAVGAYHCNQLWARGGSMGVDVFFVLSGWLITGILVREIERTGRVDFRTFMVRRIRRLGPALALLVGVTVAAHPGAWASGLAAIFYLTDFLIPVQHAGNPLTHTWSLAVEMQFYLLWPLILPMLLKFRRSIVVAALLSAWLLAHVAWQAWDLAGLPYSAAYYLPLFHCSGLLLGSALALAPRLTLPAWAGWAALADLIGLCMFGNHLFLGDWIIALAELATAVVIISPPAFLGAEPLPAFGAISYGFYLWQSPIAGWFLARGVEPPLVPVFALAMICAAMSWWLIEQPIMRWSRRPRMPIGAIDVSAARSVSNPG